MIKLHDWKNGSVVLIDPEHIGAIVSLPKSEEFAQRTRIDAKGISGCCYLVKEPADYIYKQLPKKQLPKELEKGKNDE